MQTFRKTCVVAWIVLFFLCFDPCQVANADPAEPEAQMNFMNAAQDQCQLLKRNWTAGSDPCAFHWIEVFCHKGTAYNLTLEFMRFIGFISDNTLSLLANLRRISLKHTQQNLFSTLVPNLLFAITPRLTKLFLSNNQLPGVIPVTLTFVASLGNLHLEPNLLSESPPSFNHAFLTELNVSFNQLTGPIPPTNVLQHELPESSFINNAGLCGPPVSVQCSGTPGQGDADLAPGPVPAFPPAEDEPGVSASTTWQPSGGNRMEEQRQGSRNAIVAILVGVILLL